MDFFATGPARRQTLWVLLQRTYNKLQRREATSHVGHGTPSAPGEVTRCRQETNNITWPHQQSKCSVWGLRFRWAYGLGKFAAGLSTAWVPFLDPDVGNYPYADNVRVTFINRVSIVATFPAGIFAQKFVS